MMRASRRDACEPEIVKALEAVGAKVTRVSQKGVPDLLVSYRNIWFMLECKGKNGKLTEDQETFIEFHGDCPVHVVRNVDEALIAIGARRMP